MEATDLPTVYAGEQRFELIARVLTEHGMVGIRGNKPGKLKRKKSLYVVVEHTDPQVTEWLWTATGLGRTSARWRYGIFNVPTEGNSQIYRWELQRYGEAKALLRRLWAHLTPRFQAAATQAMRSMENYRETRKISKRGRPVGRPEVISPAVQALMRLAKPTNTGLPFIDDDTAAERRQQEIASQTEPVVVPTVERGKTGIWLFDE